MKTKNNVQKTILRSVAVIISFVLISFTVSAQDFWKKLIINSSFNEIAVAMIETKTESKRFHYSPAPAVIEEPAMELEEWMANAGYFHFYTFDYQLEKDNPLNLEKWMLNDAVFNSPLENENPLALENWMVSDKHWSN